MFARSSLVRTYYVPFEDGVDEVSLVVARAMRNLAGSGRDLPRTGGQKVIEAAPVDHLADIAKVIRGGKRVRTRVVLSRLVELRPHEYEPCRTSTSHGAFGISRKFSPGQVFRS